MSLPPTPLELVAEQADDEGLWFVAQTAPEAYLQQELRKLHAAIENERDNWPWPVLVRIGRRYLDEYYPESVFTGSSGDHGPAYVVALREALKHVTA